MPTIHLTNPHWRLPFFPPSVSPSAIETGGFVPSTGIRSYDIRIAFPSLSVKTIGIFIETGLKPVEYPVLIRIESESVPGILKRVIVTTEIEPFCI
jgi:hypothetical protein